MNWLVLRLVSLLTLASIACNEGVSSGLNSGEVTTDFDVGFDVPHGEGIPDTQKDISREEAEGVAVEKEVGKLENRNTLAPDINQITGGLENAESNISASNVTSNKTSEESGNVTTIVSCSAGKENGGQPVELVNSTRLISILVTESNVTDRHTTAECVLVLFYARFCLFSSMAAPHFNALPRAFPDIKLAAVDAMKFHSFNTQYGIVGVPTIMLFHNGRPAAKFNDSEYSLEVFAKFITKYTGHQPQHKLYVTSADFGGPVPSVPTRETDYCLILSWAFMLLCGLYWFSKSPWWQWISEAVQNTWREAEAQHEHGD